MRMLLPCVYHSRRSRMHSFSKRYRYEFAWTTRMHNLFSCLVVKNNFPAGDFQIMKTAAANGTTFVGNSYLDSGSKQSIQARDPYLRHPMTSFRSFGRSWRLIKRVREFSLTFRQLVSWFGKTTFCFANRQHIFFEICEKIHFSGASTHS